MSGRRMLARFFWQLNLIITGADISPISDLGGGLVIKMPEKVIIIGKVGKNCTFLGQAGLGGGRSTKDIGAGPGLPVLRDNVSIGFGATVLGPVYVGSNTFIGPRVQVYKDIPDRSAIKLRQKYQSTIKNQETQQKSPIKKTPEPFWVLINQDINQYLNYSSDFLGNDASLLRKISIFFSPCILCNFIFRVSHCLFRSGWKRMAYFFCKINYVFQRTHISPESAIGGGLYIPHTSGIIFNGKAGKNLVLYAGASVSSQEAHVNTNRIYSDSPTLGDNIIVGAYSVVTGGITVGDNTNIGVYALLNETVETNTIILSRGRAKTENPQEANDAESE